MRYHRYQVVARPHRGVRAPHLLLQVDFYRVPAQILGRLEISRGPGYRSEADLLTPQGKGPPRMELRRCLLTHRLSRITSPAHGLQDLGLEPEQSPRRLTRQTEAEHATRDVLPARDLGKLQRQ